jgi:hypothetical protein
MLVDGLYRLGCGSGWHGRWLDGVVARGFLDRGGKYRDGAGWSSEDRLA